MRLTMLFTLLLFFSPLTLGQYSLKKNPIVENIVSEISSKQLEQTIEKLANFGTRHTLSDTISHKRGIGAARRWIFSRLLNASSQSKGRMTVEYNDTLVQPTNRIPLPVKVVNVFAILKPKLPTNRFVLISGHYDSRSSEPNDISSDAPGANDDGSGVAVVLELARIFSKYDFRTNIVFAVFAGEEQGLIGSKAFANYALKNNWNIEAVLNNDMIGNIQSGDGSIENTYVRIFSEAFTTAESQKEWQIKNSLGLENDGKSRSLARYSKEIGELYVPNFYIKLIYRRDRFLRGGDHSPFHELGFAAIRIIEAKENYDRQHQNIRIENGIQYGDLPQFIDLNYLTKNAKINAAILATLASSPTQPTNSYIEISNQSYQTILRWNRNTEDDIKGYYIRIRDTSIPFWSTTIFTTDTTVILPHSKDDFIFGIQTIDKNGNISLPVIPIPTSK